jgi:hypothetical protein
MEILHPHQTSGDGVACREWQSCCLSSRVYPISIGQQQLGAAAETRISPDMKPRYLEDQSPWGDVCHPQSQSNGHQGSHCQPSCITTSHRAVEGAPFCACCRVTQEQAGRLLVRIICLCIENAPFLTLTLTSQPPYYSLC